MREETRCCHIGYSLTARVLLYAPSYRQDRTYHTFVTPVVEHWFEREIAQWVHPMKDRSDDPSHHERTLLPRSYIWLPVPLDCTVPTVCWWRFDTRLPSCDRYPVRWRWSVLISCFTPVGLHLIWLAPVNVLSAWPMSANLIYSLAGEWCNWQCCSVASHPQ